MPELSRCLERFTPSLIVRIKDLVNRMKSAGQPVYDLSAGESDFDTDPAACAAGHAAIDGGDTKYTAVDGSGAMKAAVRRKFIRDGHEAYPDACLAVGNGAKPLLANILMTILNPGDEVIIPGPCWASHPGMVRILGADAVVVMGSADDGYRLNANNLESSITARTRALILCAPCNPTGAVYRKEELVQLAAVLRNHSDVWIVFDEIYSEILYDGLAHASMAATAPDLLDRIITVNGVSKSHAMTGWRIGYAAGPESMMNGLRQVMSQIAGSPSSIGQAAAAAALDGPADALAERRDIYRQRRDRVLHCLDRIPRLKATVPEGAFYLYVDCTDALGTSASTGERIKTSADLAFYFLERFYVAVVPAEAFEASGSFRLSYASSMDVLEKACEGIARACRDLS